MRPLQIFIGYDSREPIAYHVLAHSIISRASAPVSITPLVQGSLRKDGLYWRERNYLESTEFSFSRFLVPYLSNEYEGISIFMDCDMLCLGDIYEIAFVNSGVACCKHEYVPRESTKFLGAKQVAYPRKNWSSFMVFDNKFCKTLTVDYVNRASGLDLHRFVWISDAKVKSIPLEWNWLVGEYEPNPNAKILHYTNGGPWFDEYKNCDHADLWFAERDAMMRCAQRVTA